jgi:hypothetical protein
MRKTAFAGLATTVMLSGCAALMVSDLGAPPNLDATRINVVDKRTPSQKEARRSSAMSPIAVLGDANVQPPALLLLQAALQKNQKTPSTLNLEVDELHVIDFFPRRIRAATFATSGWLTQPIIENVIHSNTDWSFVNAIGVPPNDDSIVCMFAGTVNGKPVKAATYRQYQTSPAAVSIRNAPGFTSALRDALDGLALQILAQSGN